MKIRNAEYIFIQKHPFLRVIVDDKEALIGEFKESILNQGYVPLTSKDPNVDWGILLPEIHLPATESRKELHLKGFTDDPILIKMSREFYKAINHLDGKEFHEGPVDIPQS